MDHDQLEAEIGALLRGLRSCNTQPAAVAWMTRAFKAMEGCLDALKERPAQITRERLVFVPERPKLEVASSMHAVEVHARRRELQQRSISQTVVYPSVYLPPGLKPLPKPWTREDTLRLERAAKLRQPAIQRRGQ